MYNVLLISGNTADRTKARIKILSFMEIQKSLETTYPVHYVNISGGGLNYIHTITLKYKIPSTQTKTKVNQRSKKSVIQHKIFPTPI